MFGSDKTIAKFQQLFVEGKKYFELQKDYVTLDIVEKLTILLSKIVLYAVMLLLAVIALFYLSFTLVYVLEPYVGGLTISFAIVTAINLLVMTLVYLRRDALIVKPIVRFLTNLFLKK